jgi:hypothetical protein
MLLPSPSRDDVELVGSRAIPFYDSRLVKLVGLVQAGAKKGRKENGSLDRRFAMMTGWDRCWCDCRQLALEQRR